MRHWLPLSNQNQTEMTMKTLVATALVALSLLSGAVAAQAADQYPDWARQAFEQPKNS